MPPPRRMVCCPAYALVRPAASFAAALSADGERRRVIAGRTRRQYQMMSAPFSGTGAYHFMAVNGDVQTTVGGVDVRSSVAGSGSAAARSMPFLEADAVAMATPDPSVSP